MMRTLVFSLLFFYGLFNSAPFYAQESLNDTILFTPDFFDKDELLEITLEFNIKKFIKEKSDKEYIPANLYYKINNNDVKKEIRIKARGEYRREQCYFPPYFINVKKANMVNDFIAEANKIKVVIPCKNSKVFTNYVLKEYLAYKLFNKLTDYSFRVRLLKIKYIDTGRKSKVTEMYAFMIEPEKLIAERLEAYPLKIDKFKYSSIDSMKMTTVSIFQYMIGNTDYSVSGRHNVKLITHKDFTRPEIIAIPYDFDFSGLVNTVYALPSKKIYIKKVTERYYYGMCRSEETYSYVLDYFKEKKDEILEYINAQEHLDSKTKKYAYNFIKEFYKETEKPNFIKKYIRPTCEKTYEKR